MRYFTYREISMEGLSKRELHCFAMCRFVICVVESSFRLFKRCGVQPKPIVALPFVFFFPNKAKLNNTNSERFRNISAPNWKLLYWWKLELKRISCTRVSHFMRKVIPESKVHLCVSSQIKHLLGGDLFVDTQGTGVGMLEVRLTIYSVP